VEEHACSTIEVAAGGGLGMRAVGSACGLARGGRGSGIDERVPTNLTRFGGSYPLSAMGDLVVRKRPVRTGGRQRNYRCRPEGLLVGLRLATGHGWS
jgi:hypothetical protein